MEYKPSLEQKGRFRLQYRGVECTNCGHHLDLSDRFCPNCSQANSIKKLTLNDFIEEFFASLISYDSKILKTLSALLTKPGKITSDYIAGKRISYTNPFRFLLSLSIIYFLMLNFSGDFSSFDRYGEGQNKSIFNKNGNISFSEKGFNTFDSKLTIDNKKQLLKAIDTIKVAKTIRARDSLLMANPKAHLEKLASYSLFRRFGEKRSFFNTLIDHEKADDFGKVSEKFDIDNTKENKAAFNAAKSFSRFKKQPGSFFSNMISKLPFVIFFFLPVFAIFLWLAYIRKKYNYTEHLIFSFHNTSLLFILLMLSAVVDAIFDVYSIWFFFLVFAVYLILAMIRFYKQGFFKTFVKYIFLNIIFLTLAMFITIILLTGSLFTY